MRAAVDTPVSRRMLWIFIGVALISCAELGWWITFNIRSAQRENQLILQNLHRDIAVCEKIFSTHAPGQTALQNGQQDFLKAFFPELTLAPLASDAPHGLQRVIIHPDVLARVDAAHRRHLRMFICEGLFFLAMVLLGFILIYRTMRREVWVVHQQSNFLAAVSHEFKSPLASIRLYIETMQLRQLPADKQQRYLGMMRIDTDRLETLVGNLLAVARLDHGERLAKPEILEVGAALGHLIVNMQAEMQARRAPIQFDAPQTASWIAMDAGVFNTIVRNVLDNAAKYNTPDQTVQVSTYTSESHVVIRVTDRGHGLRSCELPRIFAKFYRVGDEMVRQTEGSGLGLYLVQQLLQQSGGYARALSEGLGHGTTIELVLPQARQD